jgi:hypothetical protein
MKLALIPPVSLLEYTDETTCQLMLPQLVGNEQYDYVYKTHGKSAEQFIILDNGLAEDAQVSGGELLRIAEEFYVDEVILPDVMKDARASRESAQHFLSDYLWPSWRLDNWPFKLQYVAQGTTFHEVLNEMHWAYDQDWIDTIGIPRHLVEIDLSIRIKLAYQYRRNGGDKPIHLLGGSPYFPTEIKMGGEWPGVRSHDTSAPFYFAYYKARLDLPVPDGATRPEGYFERNADEFHVGITNHNVKLLMEWTGNDL